MKRLKILIVLIVTSYFFFGCTGFIMSVNVDQGKNKQDITKYFVKMNKNLRKFQEEEKTEYLTLVIKTNKYNKRNNIKLIFSFENNETTEYVLKTNYPNEIEYDMKRMNKKLKRVECINLDKEESFLIKHISFWGYHISFGSLGGYVKQIHPHVTASDFLINKINSFFSVKDFILFDKENNIYIDKNRKNPPPKDYINNCKRLKEILETDFKWLNDDWDLNFVLTSSINYIDNHCFPLNYLVIYIPEEGYGDNFWQPVNQTQRIHVVLHEIIEANIHISTNINIIKTRFFYEGLAEYLSKAVIKKMNPTANFYIAYNDYEEIKKIEQEEINLKKIKYIVPKPNSSKNAYYASQYVWERLAHDYKVDIERIFEIFQEENSLENFLKHYKMLITIISQESGRSIEKVECLLKVNVSEMIGFYDKKYGFDSKYKDMVLVSLHSPYKDELKDHHFFIDKYEVSNEEYCKFLNEMGNKNEGGKRCYQGNDIIFNEKENKWYIKEGRENYPVINVSYFGARAYAEWCGKRLPTLKEYQIASSKILSEGIITISRPNKPFQPDEIKKRMIKIFNIMSKYPWGNDWYSKKCNWDEDGKIDGYQKLSPIDSFSEGKSYWGCYNLVGNVWEYVDSENIDGSIYVGGGYKHGKEFQTTNSKLTGKSKINSYDDVGFRCVKDVD